MINKEVNNFWHIRSAKYDKLYWVKDKTYNNAIIESCDLRKNHLVLEENHQPYNYPE